MLELYFLKRDLMSASWIQYEMFDIHSRHLTSLITQDLPQHLLASSWALSWALSYTFRGPITAHCPQRVHCLVLISQLLPEQHSAFTPVSHLHLAFAHSLLQVSSLLSHCAWPPGQSTVFAGTLSEGLDCCPSQPELSLSLVPFSHLLFQFRTLQMKVLV